MAFVDEKAFVPVSLLAVKESLRISNSNTRYIQHFGNIYREATDKLKLYKTSNLFETPMQFLILLKGNHRRTNLNYRKLAEDFQLLQTFRCCVRSMRPSVVK